jgi:AAA+ superfamily predicted ATPase
MDHDAATQGNDANNLFESNLLAQIISVVGWVILTMSIIVLCWVGEPCITRITSRWRQPPRCVVERGNATTLLSRLVASSDDKDGEYIVLPTEQRERLINLVCSTKEALVGKAPLKPLIFHGPSGTGKCLAAKQLSKALALPYALVSGKALAVRSSFQIDALVSWANAYSRGNGILIYIDQADEFLSKDSRRAKFIGILDGVRRDIFFILATQNVENIDRDVLDRCEQLHFSLPDAECRRELLLKYFDEHVSSINENNEYASRWLSRFIRTLPMKEQRIQSIDNGVMNGESLENSVALTRGLSGRDIYELMMSLKKKLRRSKQVA